ncbi:MAG TPA: hypothetical protein VK778_08300 [Solirubrobacteraceae bacterium]|nr:hypothetical protein [Solirubrobacteraceae bacterium]
MEEPVVVELAVLAENPQATIEQPPDLQAHESTRGAHDPHPPGQAAGWVGHGDRDPSHRCTRTLGAYHRHANASGHRRAFPSASPRSRHRVAEADDLRGGDRCAREQQRSERDRSKQRVASARLTRLRTTAGEHRSCRAISR